MRCCLPARQSPRKGTSKPQRRCGKWLDPPCGPLLRLRGELIQFHDTFASIRQLGVHLDDIHVVVDRFGRHGLQVYNRSLLQVGCDQLVEALIPVLDVLLHFAILLPLSGLPDNGCRVNICMLDVRLDIADQRMRILRPWDGVGAERACPWKEAMLCSIDVAADRLAQFDGQFLLDVNLVRR